MRAVKLLKIRKKEGEREKRGRKERVRKKRIKNDKKRIKGFDCSIQKPGSRIQDFKAEMSITIYLMIKNRENINSVQKEQ